MAPVPYKTLRFSNGFSSTIRKSANLPTSILPIFSVAPKASAASSVADFIISKG